jgi:hypothetical protein
LIKRFDKMIRARPSTVQEAMRGDGSHVQPVLKEVNSGWYTPSL